MQSIFVATLSMPISCVQVTQMVQFAVQSKFEWSPEIIFQALIAYLETKTICPSLKLFLCCEQLKFFYTTDWDCFDIPHFKMLRSEMSIDQRQSVLIDYVRRLQCNVMSLQLVRWRY